MKLALTAIATTLFTTLVAGAATISVNFASIRENGSVPLDPNDTAGVAPFAASNWNNAFGRNGTLNTLNDSNGNAVAGVSASFVGDKGNYDAANSFLNTGDSKLMFGYLDSGYNFFDNGNTGTTFSGLTTDFTAAVGGYNVIVYFRGAGTIQINGTSATSTPAFAGAELQNPNAYVQALSPTAALATPANYALFTGLTASSFKASGFNTPGNFFGISGIQIVSASVPEPTTLTLLLAPASMMLMRRRQA